MDEFYYLVALAFIEQGDSRLMPIGGKSIKGSDPQVQPPQQLIESISLELLVRLINRSKDGAIRSAAGEQSILLLKIPMISMQENLPSIKADWLRTGETDHCMNKLHEISNSIWHLSFEKYKGIKLTELKK